MSAPPLPDIFGNYVLQDFVEVVAPTAISWLPQTKGWLILGLVLIAFLLRYCARRVRLWYSNRYRREAEKRLQELEQAAVQSKLLSELNRLLKLTAMAAFSREQVARLSGDEWVDFLNSCCPTAPFPASCASCWSLAPTAVSSHRMTPDNNSLRPATTGSVNTRGRGCLSWHTPGHCCCWLYRW